MDMETTTNLPFGGSADAICATLEAREAREACRNLVRCLMSTCRTFMATLTETERTALFGGIA